MPLYHYKAIGRDGKSKSGYIDAHSEVEARGLLREQGVMLKTLSTKTSSWSSQDLKGDRLMTFTIQLAQLVSARVPLYQSLATLEEQYRHDPTHRVFLGLCDQIKAGTSLSEAMKSFPQSFDNLYCSMVAAGEAVGSLDVVLNRLSHLLSKQAKLKRQISTAMIYPSILASFSLLIIGLLLGFVVPSIEGIFMDRKLNGFTQFILSVSHIAQDYWWLYIPLIVGGTAYGIFKLRSEKGKIWLQRNVLKLPIVGKLAIEAAVARFCRTMGTLQQGGLPIMESLRTARKVMNNVVLEEDIKRAENRIIEGSSLSSEIARSSWFPIMVSRMLAVGEDTGSSVTMLNKLADMYEEDMEKNLDKVIALAQPIILILMGTVIGAILLAILLPLTDISSLAL